VDSGQWKGRAESVMRAQQSLAARGAAGGGGWLRRLAVVAPIALILVTPAAIPASAAEDAREAKARSLFAIGEYQSALEVFVTLFGERGDPLLLRSIGRCYQKMRQPAKAIDAYQEYLRRYPRMKPAERREIEGFVEEARKLKAAEAAALPAPPSVEPPPVDSTPATQSTPARPSPSPSAPIIDDTELTGPAASAGNREPPPTLIGKPQSAQAAPESQPNDNKSLTSRWWFWTGLGALVVGGAVAAILLATGGGTSRPDCQPSYVCPH